MGVSGGVTGQQQGDDRTSHPQHSDTGTPESHSVFPIAIKVSKDCTQMSHGSPGVSPNATEVPQAPQNAVTTPHPHQGVPCPQRGDNPRVPSRVSEGMTCPHQGDTTPCPHQSVSCPHQGDTTPVPSVMTPQPRSPPHCQGGDIPTGEAQPLHDVTAVTPPPVPVTLSRG